MSRMVFLFLVLQVAALAPDLALAQGPVLGLRGGVAIATLGGDQQDEVESRTGPAVAAYAAFPVSDQLRIAPELMYVLKGGKAQDAGTVTLTSSYVELSVPAAVVIPIGGGLLPRIYAGPTIAFELGCDIKTELEFVTVKVDCDDAGSETKAVDLGVMFGAGIDIAAGPGAITFDARYDLGLTNINDRPDDDLDVKNRAWLLLLGYAYRLGQ